MGLLEELNPLLPIVEIAGDHRVLIENHRGVKEYTHSLITVSVPKGAIEITGKELLLTRMTKEQLVITGWIQCVRLCKKEAS